MSDAKQEVRYYENELRNAGEEIRTLESKQRELEEKIRDARSALEQALGKKRKIESEISYWRAKASDEEHQKAEESERKKSRL